MPQKPPAGARGRATSERKTKESKVPINTRLEQNPGQSFRCSAGKLFCAACVFVIPNISANIGAHVQTTKHTTNLARFNARNTADINLMVSLGEYFRANPDEEMASVDPNDHLFRFRTVEAFMHAGVAISKIDMFKSLLMRGGRSLPAATHLRSYIPKVESNELDQISGELLDQYVSAIFDSTTRLGELMNLVLRWCTDDFYIVQRLASLITLANHMTGLQVASHLAQILLTRYKLPILNLICNNRDSCATNGVAVRSLSNTFVGAEDILCLCHTLSHVGEHFSFPQLMAFMTIWIKLVYTVTAAKRIWRLLIDEPVQGHSNVRWYCVHEIMMQIARKFNLIPAFLSKLADLNVAPVLRPQLCYLYKENTRGYSTLNVHDIDCARFLVTV
jgi:hypothetical protein